jgi:hypothetical protein
MGRNKPNKNRTHRYVKVVLCLALLLAVGALASGALGQSTDGSGTPTDTTATTTTAADTTGPSPTATTATTTTDATPSDPVLSAPAASPLTPTISSDLEDYPPGATVTLTGSGWGPNESVHLFVNDSAGQSWSYDAYVTADPFGSFTDAFQLPNWFVANYTAAASDSNGLTASASFTDANIAVQPGPAANGNVASRVKFDVTYQYYSNTTCGGTAANGGTFGLPTGNGTSPLPSGDPHTSSVLLTAAAQSKPDATTTPPTVAKSFKKWTLGNNQSAGSDYATTQSICLATAGNGGTYYAWYDNPVAVAATNSTVTVNEGATATNTGTWSDPDASDTVALSASVGTVTKNSDGTWSWSRVTTDGPSQSATVTITADDGAISTTTTFALTVNNVVPTVSGLPATAVGATQNASQSFSLGSFTDPGTDANWTASVNWGDGGSAQTITGSPFSSTGSLGSMSHTYTTTGTKTVTVSVTDKDGGVGSASFSVTVSSSILSTSLSVANASGTYGGTTSLSAILTSGGSGVSGKTISFTLNGTTVCGGVTGVTCPTTNSSGVATLSNVSLSGINAGTYSTGVGGSFAGDTFYSTSSGTGSLTVNQAAADCSSLSGYTVTFDGSSHTASGSCKDLGGTALAGLDKSGTTHTDAGTYNADSWTFAGTTNYAASGGTVNDKINQAAADCSSLSGYTVTYDAASHTASGSCKDLGGTALAGLDKSATTHTDAGTYNADPWTFAGTTNYAAAGGTVDDKINQAAADCSSLSGYTVTYDGNSHTAAGSCKDLGGTALVGLDKSATTHADAGTYNADPWTFAGTTNYAASGGTVDDKINQAAADCSSISGYTVTYDGNAHTAAGSCKDLGGSALAGLDKSGTTHTDAGT